MRLALVAIVAVTSIGVVRASTYEVQKTGDTGYRTLRWAITNANTHPGPDTITFAPALAGKTIRPATALPDITDAGTVINGDINGDGKPDILLNGKDLTSGHGLCVCAADGCTIRGVAIVNFPWSGIMLSGSDNCVVRSCHIGVNLPGTGAARNGSTQLHIHDADAAIIGGTSASDRNVIAGGDEATGGQGIWVRGGTGVRIQGNYVGLRADGTAWLDSGYVGINIETLSAIGGSHQIGGAAGGAGNSIVGASFGIRLSAVNACNVQGNRFGLAADGDTPLSKSYSTAMILEAGAHHNLIGGTSAGARNVFAGHTYGVTFTGAGTEANRLFGNYFGLNAAGTKQRYLSCAVALHGNAGANQIGGATAATGNTICPCEASGWMTGVWLNGAGSGTSVRNNTLGVLPSGKLAKLGATLVQVRDAYGIVTDSTLGGGALGIWAVEAGGLVDAYRNTFRACTTAVYISDGANCRLGNLGNPSTADDGGNTFLKSNTQYINNQTTRRIRAEGNSFGTTVRAEIDAKIYDKLDNPGWGRVDFDPLAGGVHPSDAGGVLALTGLSAVPTAAGGAEVVFSLAADASVSAEVLNLAGRPIALVARDLPASPGLNRVVWSGMTSTGTRAPAGRYLVRVSARNAGEAPSSGQQATGLCTLLLR